MSGLSGRRGGAAGRDFSLLLALLSVLDVDRCELALHGSVGESRREGPFSLLIERWRATPKTAFASFGLVGCRSLAMSLNVSKTSALSSGPREIVLLNLDMLKRDQESKRE